MSQSFNVYYMQQVIKTKYFEQESISKMKKPGQEFMKIMVNMKNYFP